MRVFIDTNARWSGGYIAHLRGILNSGCIPSDSSVIVYGTKRIFDTIGPVDDNVTCVIDKTIPLNPAKMILWRYFNIPKLLISHSADIHFSLSGDVIKINNSSLKHVVLSHNLQPHLKSERQRFSWITYNRFRLEILNRKLRSSFQRADGVIFLSEYAREYLLNDGYVIHNSTVIPHGINDNFRRVPVSDSLTNKPVLLYVSSFLKYKFQWQVARGVAIARNVTGIDLQLQLVGQKTPEGMKLLIPVLSELGNPSWISLIDNVPYDSIHKIYHGADIFLFASTVENFPNIVLEAMASGLPIACSNRRPMTDILIGSCLTFDPEQPRSIADAIVKYLKDADIRHRYASDAYRLSLDYSWQRTAHDTFKYLNLIYNS